MNLITHFINLNIFCIAAWVSLQNTLVCWQHLQVQNIYNVIWDFVPFTLATEILCIYVMCYIIIQYHKAYNEHDITKVSN